VIPSFLNELPVVNDPGIAHFMVNSKFWEAYPIPLKGMVVVNKACQVRYIIVHDKPRRVFITDSPIIPLLEV
jgi:hypothetical protein